METELTLEEMAALKELLDEEIEYEGSFGEDKDREDRIKVLKSLRDKLFQENDMERTA